MTHNVARLISRPISATVSCTRPRQLAAARYSIYARAFVHLPNSVAMETVNTSDRLASLRKLMSERGVDIYSKQDTRPRDRWSLADTSSNCKSFHRRTATTRNTARHVMTEERFYLALPVPPGVPLSRLTRPFYPQMGDTLTRRRNSLTKTGLC